MTNWLGFGGKVKVRFGSSVTVLESDVSLQHFIITRTRQEDWILFVLLYYYCSCFVSPGFFLSGKEMKVVVLSFSLC